ncbi:MAG: inositol 2-dehydrogenase [Alphaproteobacteria bacterium]|nr:inositol 2-dehydrogenase [Alphaproteobacteria bacterium]
MVTISVIGCGRIGRMHLRNIAASGGARLGPICDPYAADIEGLAREHDVAAVESAEAIFADSSVDAVLVASATETHAAYIEAGVKAGKAVFCEKPIDLDLERVDACAAAIAGLGGIVQLGFNRRFDPGHRAAFEALRGGEIGALHQVVITSRDPEMPPRSYVESAGGLLRDMTIHDFDLARFFLGEEPEEVFAVGNALIDPELGEALDDFDTAMILLRCADGKQCCINNSRTAVYGYDQRVELLGERGMLVSGNRRAHEMRRFGGAETERGEPYLYFFIERYGEAFVAELEAFVGCVRDGARPEVGFEDGRRALVLAEAAYKSIKEGRLVRVDEIS